MPQLSQLGVFCAVIAVSLPTIVGDPAANAESPKFIAGRTVEDYAAQLGDSDRVVRLRAAKSLGAFGSQAGEALVAALDHDDAAVRYLAAVHLGRNAGDPLKSADARLEELAGDESSLAVRLAASYALCCGGKVDQHLTLLVETLKYPERGTACSAAELIGMLGPRAKAAVEPLEAAYQQHRPGSKGGDYHIAGAAKNALRKIREEDEALFQKGSDPLEGTRLQLDLTGARRGSDPF